jgi:hypothetical protein
MAIRSINPTTEEVLAAKPKRRRATVSSEWIYGYVLLSLWLER